MEILLLIGALALFIGIIVWAVKYTKKVNNRKIAYFENFAKLNNLDHSTSKNFLVLLNEVNGQLEGCQFQLYEKMVSSGKNKQVITNVQFSNTPFNFDFKIGKEHLFSKTGKLLGLKDIEFRDEKFDKTFLLKSKSEDEFRALMTYENQAKLMEIEKDLKASIHCTNGQLTYSYMGPLANEKVFNSCENVIDFMKRLIKSSN